MPTYEYRCRDCAREFEVFQRMSDRPGAPCPDCGSAAERLISGGAGLLFRGDGFYITDYRSDDYRKKAREEAGVGGRKDGGRESGGREGSKKAGSEAAVGTGASKASKEGSRASKEGSEAPRKARRGERAARGGR